MRRGGNSFSDNLIGSAWMVASMAFFALEDAALKFVATDLPVGQLMVIFGFGGALVFAGLALARGEPLVVPEVASRPMVIRMFFEVFGRLFYTLAIALTPLAATTVILQAAPIVVVAGAAMVFGERVGWRRWAAIGLGLLGVLVILRPGSEAFSALSILAVFGMLGFAGRDLASRAAPKSLGTAVLGFYGFLAILAAGIGLSLWQGVAFVGLGWTGAGLLVLAVLCGVLGYGFLMKAMRTGEVSAVAPFRYSRLLFGVALGVVIFGETLDGAMVLGSGLIVLAGLFILWRGRSAGG